MKETISIRLLKTLQHGVAQLSPEAKLQVIDFVRTQQTGNGAFKNKGNKADLYYTVFGWMLCFVLGIKLDSAKMNAYLGSIQPEELDLIHFAAYVRCATLASIAQKGKILSWIGSIRPKAVKPIHQFAGIPHDDPQSPYSQFIWLSLLEDTGNKPGNPEEIEEQLTHYETPEGGYRNLADGLGATTNATVAALSVLGQIKGYEANKSSRFLQELQQENGGFRAAEASPVPDLLSTATALFTLQCYRQKPPFHPGDFLEAHWLNSGGFCPTLIDESSDVEYTFYGLLALGTIA